MTTPSPYPMPQDPEVRAFIELSNSFYPADAFLGTVEQSRNWYNRYAAAMAQPFPPNVAAEDFTIAGPQPGQSIAARRYRNIKANADVPNDVTVLYIHGGGFVLGGLESHADVCAGLCQLSGLDVVATTYRLAPEHRHPAQLDDVQAAFQYVRNRGEKIILCGDSAGGNLAAALSIRLQAQGQQPALGQVLIYPGLGGDVTQGSYLSNAHAPMLTTEESAYYFAVRSEGLSAEQSNQPELRPLLAEDFSATPQTLVVTADIDPLRDDGVHYVNRLLDAGVNAQYRNEPELVHGYLRARHTSQWVRESFSAIADALKKMASGTF
ncbi:alpha/beta hydrolase [Rhodoferax sp. GW822-FHT02A01]|uniref:alpha/beta hydrolase n=1 Tax=Rhodoferax sp. GW822-FHT02A01 TaxID=3141537 RepID=UPI00315CDE13